jgi:hypothetical protein
MFLHEFVQPQAQLFVRLQLGSFDRLQTMLAVHIHRLAEHSMLLEIAPHNLILASWALDLGQLADLQVLVELGPACLQGLVTEIAAGFLLAQHRVIQEGVLELALLPVLGELSPGDHCVAVLTFPELFLLFLSHPLSLPTSIALPLLPLLLRLHPHELLVLREMLLQVPKARQ